MKTISLCMIVRNEQLFLEKCLQSVYSFVDEIIVVDTGSTDRTIEIAEKYGAKVFHYEWDDHFAKARNFSIKQATGDWILWLDADEQLELGTSKHLREVLNFDDTIQIVFLEHINFYGNSPPSFHRSYRLSHHRLFRNHLNIYFEQPIHERLDIKHLNLAKENTASLPVKVLHYGYLDDTVSIKNKHDRNLSLLERLVKEKDSDPWVYYHLSNEYYRTMKYEKAYDYVNRSIIQFLESGQIPPAMIYKLKYTLLILLESFEGAWPVIDKAIKLYPDYVDLHYYRGVILFHLQNYKEAIESFNDCIQLGDDRIDYLTQTGLGTYEAMVQIGNCYKLLSDNEKAIEYYTKALKLYPEHEQAKKALESFHL